jgi:hypothetical protein
MSGVTIPGGIESLAAGGTMLSGLARAQFAAALHQVFVGCAVLSGASLVATTFLPPVDFSRGLSAAAGERMIEAEMANLAPRDEPVTVRD